MIRKIFSHSNIGTRRFWVHAHETGTVVLWSQEESTPYTASEVIMLRQDKLELIKALCLTLSEEEREEIRNTIPRLSELQLGS